MSLSIQETKQIQTLLVGMNGGPADGFPGKQTKLAASNYQKYISKTNITGNIEDIKESITLLHSIYVIDPPTDIHCKCGECSGYGFEKYGAISGSPVHYRQNKPEIEAYYQYEYPGISEMTLNASKLIIAMYPEYSWTYNSGYRCWIDNLKHGRKSTNHMGKAIDIQPHDYDGSSFQRSELIKICDNIRTELQERRLMNIGWNKRNMISLEPSNISPTWIHLDCRSFDRKWIEASIVKF